MITYPPCKINIGLNIINKRTDGYHNIESVFYPIPFFDILEINVATAFSFSSSGLPIHGDKKNNLVVQAYEILKTKYNIGPVKIHLHKRIPMGAGLGGGSADAAHTITMLNQLFDLKLSTSLMETIALSLGSDCPFFIEDRAKFVTGRGESMTPSPIDLKGYYLYLINPGVHVSTKAAYAAINYAPNPDKLEVAIQVEDWKNKVYNQFELPIFKLHPSIRKIKETLYNMGAVYASMSGTGSTVYGLFKTEPKLLELYNFEKIRLL
ncbi:4-(cytidine 5'-diphospho)-2-C-methyl-D-erythritol kinase [Putridiphycobacter roseus]|uniref:4-diphosphocytidyl-2-C-methyl-D-erythritol kinase n=1 Tax=Putridiphycobacter roseus TaxID=2219161 RepID=A0A2W1N3W4_9FLAO|nr:4-(cytidine 5'-diphospho)-2-C-methyl-D-erythritol kinase [Putridiphycobacter roseus]PZE17741.1 4-(cytidine 5'-diphospho)-2-C-methyl-D-erythritol kinase [Putridiphycobacter roseus]